MARWAALQEQPTEKVLTCYVCKITFDKSQTNVFTSPDSFDAGTLYRYECPECHVIFGDLRFLRLSRKEISNDYEDLYSYYQEGNTTKYILQCLKESNFYKTSLSYLDFACGNFNNVMSIMKQEGFDIDGYDKHQENYKNKPTRLFDVVYCCNYIEHVIRPSEDIGEMLQFVKPGGSLLLISPCFEYYIEYTHYHTFFFSDKALQILCKELGMTQQISQKIMFGDGQWSYVKAFRKEGGLFP